MSGGQAPAFSVDLGDGDPLELGGWASLEHLSKEVQDRVLADQIDHASMYRQCFATPAGRYVLHDLMVMYLQQRIVRPGDPEHAPGIRQGGADVVQRILAMIEFANTGGRPTGPGAAAKGDSDGS